MHAEFSPLGYGILTCDIQQRLKPGRFFVQFTILTEDTDRQRKHRGQDTDDEHHDQQFQE